MERNAAIRHGPGSGKMILNILLRLSPGQRTCYPHWVRDCSGGCVCPLRSPSIISYYHHIIPQQHHKQHILNTSSVNREHRHFSRNTNNREQAATGHGSIPTMSPATAQTLMHLKVFSVFLYSLLGPLKLPTTPNVT